MIKTFIILFLILVCNSYAKADFYGILSSSRELQFINIPTQDIRIANRKQLNYPYEKLLQQAADQYALDPNFLRAIMKSESNFKSNAISPKGARGLMQLMPNTARILKVRNINNPSENINGGAYYLRRLLNWYKGNRKLASAAYNAGPLSIKKYGGVPPFKETKKYVNKVLAYYMDYRRQ